MAHSHTKIPAERATRGNKSIKSGSSIPTPGLSKYISYLAFYLTFPILTAMIVEWLVALPSRVIPLGMPK